MGQNLSKKAWFRFRRWTHFQLSVYDENVSLSRSGPVEKNSNHVNISTKNKLNNTTQTNFQKQAVLIYCIIVKFESLKLVSVDFLRFLNIKGQFILKVLKK